MTDSTTEAKVCRMVNPESLRTPDELADISDYELEQQPKKLRRVAICGSSATTAGLAPISVVEPDGSPTWEVWTLGIAQKFYQRQDRHFQLHNLEDGAGRWSDDYKLWLNTTKVPVYLQQINPAWVPSGVQYPLQDILRRFPNGNYQTSQIALLIALAIYEDVDEIGIYGCDLAHDAEYVYQRPCVEYWLGVAEGMGINVFVPKESDLLKGSQIYAFQTHGGALQAGWHRCLEQRDREIKARLAGYQKQLEDCTRAVHTLAGANENMRYIRHWLGHDGSYSGRDYVMEETDPAKVLSRSDGKP